jgi:hypothetical protein
MYITWWLPVLTAPAQALAMLFDWLHEVPAVLCQTLRLLLLLQTRDAQPLVIACCKGGLAKLASGSSRLQQVRVYDGTTNCPCGARCAPTIMQSGLRTSDRQQR